MLPPPKHVLAVALLVVAGLRAVGPAAPAGASPVTLDEARELHRAGRLEDAAAAYRAVVEQAGLDPASRAAAGNNLCVVLDAVGDLAAAEAACLETLALRRSLGDRQRLARTLNNLGLVLQHLGRYSQAEERFSEALAINRDLEEPLAQTINLGNLGAVATLAGRFQEALERHGEARDLALEHADAPWSEEQLRVTQLNRGVALERLGAYREALEVYRELLEESPSLSLVARASILVNSGVVYRNLGDPVQAIERFEAAEAIYRELGDPAGMAHAELNIGIARHLDLDDAIGAEAAYRGALSRVEESGDRALGIEIHGSLGRLLASIGRPDEARGHYERSLALARESGSVEGTWTALAGLAEVDRYRGELEAALRGFEEAIALIEDERVEVSRPEHRASFFADKRSVYSGALETLSALDDRDKGAYAARGLEVAQRAKSRDLLDALGGRSGGAGHGTRFDPLGEQEITRRLDDDLLVEYFVADRELLMWWTQGDSVRLASLGDPEPILEQVVAIHKALARGSEPNREDVARLSRALLEPASEALFSTDSASAADRDGARVWIAPDLRLRYLPFEILHVPAGHAGASEPVRWIERARISYLPSAWALPPAPPVRPPRTGAAAGAVGPRFLGFGGIDFARRSAYPVWVSRLALEPLPAAGRELAEISRRLGGKRLIFQGAEATEESFRQSAGATAGVMHFATHAVLSERRGEGPAILLTPAAEDDGMLTPAEVADTRVGAGLVVLAACATALGSEGDGRALTSLTGAFLAAGARGVLATLWPIGDQPTAVFMDQFYHQLSKGLAPAEALRRTKLRFLSEERWSHPALWSGYVLAGSAPPLVAARNRWLWGWGALALALAVGWAVRRARAPRMKTSDG